MGNTRLPTLLTIFPSPPENGGKRWENGLKDYNAHFHYLIPIDSGHDQNVGTKVRSNHEEIFHDFATNVAGVKLWIGERPDKFRQQCANGRQEVGNGKVQNKEVHPCHFATKKTEENSISIQRLELNHQINSWNLFVDFFKPFGTIWVFLRTPENTLKTNGTLEDPKGLFMTLKK